MLYFIPDRAKRLELEQYRQEFEAINGPTDLTRRYTSMWPRDQEDWLFQNATKHWFDGLPLFVRAYLCGKMDIAVEEGRMDDMPDELVRLYMNGEMTIRRSRGR